MTIKSLYPASRPALGIDFAKTKRLDPRVTFTRASTATYVDNGGVIRTAGSGVARFDHTGSGESLGLLVEEAKTNNCWYSNFQQFVAAGSQGWNPLGGATATQNAAIAPDNTNTALLMQEDSSNGSHYISWVGPSPTATLTASIFVKTAGVTTVRLSIFSGASATFNLTNLTATPSIGTALIQAFPNGWHRISVTTDAVIGVQNYGNFSLALGSGNYQGNGTSGVYIWGAQYVSGSLTSHIPTSGSTVTRAADVATLSNANSSIFPTSAFTVVNTPFGTAGGGSTVKLVGPTVKRTAIYDGDLTQAQINTLTNTGDFWRWRVLGSSFALPGFTTNGSVTVDWGDGVVETLTTAAHTFTNGGGYHDIGFRLNSGTFFKPSIGNNATYAPRVIAVGPAPASMKVDGVNIFYGCTALRGMDGHVDLSPTTNFSLAWIFCSSLVNFPLVNTSAVTAMFSAWRGCSGLTSFPLIDTSLVTNFIDTWNGCSGLTSFPLINTGAGTSLGATWYGCSSLTSFPLINTAAATSLSETWRNCSSLTSFPLINVSSATSLSSTWSDCAGLTSFPLINTASITALSGTWNGCVALVSFPLINTSAVTNFSAAWRNCFAITPFPLINTGAGTNFQQTWQNCFSLTSFPLINTSAGTNFSYAWYNCSGLTSFPALNFASATTFNNCWQGCSSLATFPANVFNATGTLASDAFLNAFTTCALTATSIENILTSLVTNGQSNITLSLEGGSNAGATTWTTAANTAYATLITRGWTITRRP
jgi:hypothetical protein